MAENIELNLIIDDAGTATLRQFAQGARKHFGDIQDQVENKLGKSLRGFGSSIGGVFKSITGSIFSLKGAIVGLAGAAGIGALAKNAIDTAAGFEKLKISLDTITQGKGEETFRKLNEWALKMPVNTEKAIETFTRLKAMGMDPTLDTMTTLVDTMGALGGGEDMMMGIANALGQITTKGKVSSEEILQLAERGVPAFEILREKLNLTQKDMENMGKAGISSSDAVNALLEGMAERFAGQSQKMQSTWSGMMETLKSYWKEFIRLVMESGVFDKLKETVGAVVARLDEMAKSGELTRMAEQLGTFLVDNIGPALDKAREIFSDIGAVMEKMMAAWKAIAEYVKEFMHGVEGMQMMYADIKGAVGGAKESVIGKAKGVLGWLGIGDKDKPQEVVVEPMIKKSPVVPWAEGIKDMLEDLSGLSADLKPEVSWPTWDNVLGRLRNRISDSFRGMLDNVLQGLTSKVGGWLGGLFGGGGGGGIGGIFGSVFNSIVGGKGSIGGIFGGGGAGGGGGGGGSIFGSIAQAGLKKVAQMGLSKIGGLFGGGAGAGAAIAGNLGTAVGIQSGAYAGLGAAAQSTLASMSATSAAAGGATTAATTGASTAGMGIGGMAAAAGPLAIPLAAIGILGMLKGGGIFGKRSIRYDTPEWVASQLGTSVPAAKQHIAEHYGQPNYAAYLKWEEEDRRKKFETMDRSYWGYGIGGGGGARSFQSGGIVPWTGMHRLEKNELVLTPEQQQTMGGPRRLTVPVNISLDGQVIQSKIYEGIYGGSRSGRVTLSPRSIQGSVETAGLA